MKSISWGLQALLVFGNLSAVAGDATSEIRYTCQQVNDSTDVQLILEKKRGAFHIRAQTAGMELFAAKDQRPSLNARIADGTNDQVKEFVDFNPRGLEVVPVDGKNKLEIDLGPSPVQVHYTNEKKDLLLSCQINSRRLIGLLGLRLQQRPPVKNIKSVAFDIDDTLAFTSPSFARGFATGGTPQPTDVLFWSVTNGCDPGCPETEVKLPNGELKLLPSNSASSPKHTALELVRLHQSLGHQVYAITARPDINGDVLRKYIEDQFGIPSQNVFFEPDIDQSGNAAGKTDRIESLNLDIFYGDSDSDITDAMKAFVDPKTGLQSKTVLPIRFLRSPKSSNRKAGQLNKYHPGYFDEMILTQSYY